jgi:hypothetical protein
MDAGESAVFKAEPLGLAGTRFRPEAFDYGDMLIDLDTALDLVAEQPLLLPVDLHASTSLSPFLVRLFTAP